MKPVTKCLSKDMVQLILASHPRVNAVKYADKIKWHIKQEMTKNNQWNIYRQQCLFQLLCTLSQCTLSEEQKKLT
jgi:hypothetical protein